MGYLTMDMDYVREVESELEEYRATGLTPEEIKKLVTDVCKGDIQQHQEKLRQMIHDRYEEALKGGENS